MDQDDDKFDALILSHNMEFSDVLWSPKQKKRKRSMGFICDIDSVKTEDEDE